MEITGKFKHGTKPGWMTVAGKSSEDLAPGTFSSPEAVGLER
jgi:predicted RNA binding protein YcfA (HicA-like mRNA interferase family)